MILDIAASVLEIANSVLANLISEYLVKQWLDRQQKTEIPEPEIENIIRKIVQEQRNEISIKVENVNLFIGEVKSEIKILSRRLRNLEVVYDKENNYDLIRVFESNQEENETFDPQKWTDLLNEQLEKAVNSRLEEITKFSSTPNNKVPSTPPSKAPVGEDKKPPLPPKVPTGNKNPSEEKMPNYLGKLPEYKEYGESILKGITAFKENQSLPDEVRPQLSKCLQELEESAKKTIESATSPVKIAIMGEISSGKTLLLGSLIGYADALPVNEVATTGNVTAIHLIQQEEEKTTQVDQFEVEYLSESGVENCLRFMVSEAKQRAQAAEVSSTELERLNNFSNTKPVNWNELLQWCEQAWNNSDNLELRYLIRELVVFARSYQAYGKNLCGKRYKIAQTTAKEGLKLAKPQNIAQIKFSSLPPEPQQWQNWGQPSAQDLQNSFSLIRRIDVEAKVSKQIWELSSLTGSNELVLLDLPGLGSENSGVRDSFLSMLEIEAVQTFLLLLNGRAASPGQAATRIYSMIQKQKKEDVKDRIIVGVGRFNQLPLNGANQQAIDNLIGDDRPFELTEQEVFSQLDILHQIITNAENLTTKKERILLLSQTYGLAKLAQESRLVEVCSPEFKVELDQVNKLESDEFKLRQKWKKLSEMLLESSPHGQLGKKLSDFADDGGIGRLRSLLQEHVAEYGLEQLCKDAEREAQALRQQQNNLKRILESIRDNPIPESSPAYTDLRQAIDGLKTTYLDLKEKLRKQPLLEHNEVAVSDVVKDELSFKIHRWDEWTALFNSIQDGIIQPASTSKTVADGIFKRPRSKSNNSIPTQSDDFSPTFKKTFEELTDSARNHTHDALEELLRKLSDEVETERNTLAKILRPEMEQQIEEVFGDNAANLFYALQQSDKPNDWLNDIITAINTVPPQTSNSQTLFPLASKDDLHEFGQIFDWSLQKESSAESRRPFNHEFLVLRLRSEMVASAGLNLADYVSQLTEVVNFELSTILNTAINALLNLSNNELLLRYIATGNEQTNNPLWLQTLSQISLISYPQHMNLVI